MADFDTAPSQLPVPVAAAAPRPSLVRTETDAAFVSQLLAERDRLPPQRQRRRASVEGAAASYASGARLGVSRLPAGYRKSVVI